MRKFGITLMHGKITEPVMKYMVGKHISKDLRTYIQNNRETFKAFKLIEPLISLTKSNGNGSGQMAKQLEELKKERFKVIIMQKLIEKTTPKQVMQNAMEEIERELGITKETVSIRYDDTEKAPDLTTRINELAKAYEKKDLERILKENGNNNQ
jgi:GTPase Era involved in 16S rRNA processing